MKVFGLLVWMIGFGVISIAVARAEGTPEQMVLIQSDIAELRDEHVSQVLKKGDGLIRSEVLSDEAKFRRLVDATYLTEAAAAEAVANGLEAAPLVRAKLERMRKDFLAGAQVEMLVANALENADLDKAAEEYFKAHREEFMQEKTLHAAHILFKDGEDSSAEERAQQVLEKLESGEVSFEDAARKYSADTGSAPKGGDLGWVKKGQLVPSFADALFAMEQPGDLAGPIKSRFGVHLIQLKALKGETVAAFEEVAPAIKKKLVGDLTSKVREDYFIGLRDDRSVVIFQQNIQDLYKREREKLESIQ